MDYFKCRVNMVHLQPTTEVLFQYLSESSWPEYVEILNTIFTYVTPICVKPPPPLPSFFWEGEGKSKLFDQVFFLVFLMFFCYLLMKH